MAATARPIGRAVRFPDRELALVQLGMLPSRYRLGIGATSCHA